ncbi:MAG: hypothetical protein J5I59_12760 [Saprospiraceae bacterium]|nr:hypothetical protein [Saprospiraceae bacterium]
MKNTSILTGVLFALIFYGTTCREEIPTNCEIGLCPPMYIYINVSNSNDTMYVGDTLELSAQVPDRVYEFSTNGDTVWHEVVQFQEQAMDYALYFLDSINGAVKAASPKVTIIKEEGGSYEDRSTFSSTYPYRFKYKIVFHSIGTYFFQTAYDNGYNLNGESYMRGAVLEWNVPSKNFELLKDLEGTCQNCTIEDLKSRDDADFYNFFPFLVKER